ncbi:cyclic nucleotide-binding domain-containing protein [candidate division KSB1 bacterium]|nr:cyclic nucleotide-binding domain-containing protein [candidate division KSB1 bacterium]
MPRNGLVKKIIRLLDHRENRIVESIKRISLFQNFSDGDIQALAERCHIRYFNSEEEIYAEGSPATALYFIISGSVGIYKKRRSHVTDRIQVLHAGTFFGDSSLVSEEPRKNSSKAMEKSLVLVLFKTDFDRLEQMRPRLALKFYKIVTNKYYNELTIFQTEFHELSQKVAKDELMK